MVLTTPSCRDCERMEEDICRLDRLCRRALRQSGKKTVRIIELRQRAEAAERVVEVAQRHYDSDDFLLLLDALEDYDKKVDDGRLRPKTDEEVHSDDDD